METSAAHAVQTHVGYKESKGPIFGARHVQILFIAFGNGILYSTKYTFSLIIVDMTNQHHQTSHHAPVYKWDNINVIISSIFWSGMWFQLFGGHFGSKYGHKWFIFFASLTNAVAFIFIPSAAAYFGSNGVIVCRIIQGVCQGTFTPLQACVIGLWVPPEERSRSASAIALGVSLSIIGSSLIVGVISKSSLGWPWAIYIFGMANCVWSIGWFYCGQQSPTTHPRITAEEQKYIQVTLQQKEHNTKRSIPWIKIFSSRSVWAVIVGQIGSIFVLNMLLTENSNYLAHVMEFEVPTIALITAISIIAGAVTGVIIAILSDYIIKKRILSIVNCRRVCHLTGQIGNSLTITLMTFIPRGYSKLMMFIVCLQSVFTITIGVAGSEVNGYDIAPDFASIIYGVSGTLSECAALFGPLLVHWIVKNLEDIESWRYVYCITASIAIVTAIFFAVFASDKRKRWEKTSEHNQRSISLNSNYK